MSKDFSSDKGFPNPFGSRDIQFFPQNLREGAPRRSLTTIYNRDPNTNESVTLPYRPHQSLERLPEILQQLHSLKPLYFSGNQRELARQALTALKNRTKDDIKNLAKRLADDVAGAID